MNFLHYEFHLKKGDVVEIALDKQANVQLPDELNFSNYKNRRKYNSNGGLSKN